MIITKKDVFIPQRQDNAHKGTNGKLLIIGGSELFVGAPALAAKAAFRAGVDIVKVIAPSKVAWALNHFDPSIITIKLNCKSFSRTQIPAVLKAAKNVDAILLGNGLGRNLIQKAFVRELLLQIDKPIVIDADALHATNLLTIKSKKVICTPHYKEFLELLKIVKSKEDNIKNILRKDVIILKKGPTDTIITKDKLCLNKTGCPQMAVAGTGDVLAGFAAGLLAQKISPLQAAMSAAFIVGKAGEKTKKKYGNFSATELLDEMK